MSYTINALPKYGVLYLGTDPVTSLSEVSSLSPSVLATLAYQPLAPAMLQEQDIFTYYVTDNAGTKSNNATYVMPFSLIDSHGDSYANRNDFDDDNDGITDIEECPLNDFVNLAAMYPDGFAFIRPSHLGFTIVQRQGLDTTVDISAVFGKPIGSMIVTIVNGNTHPYADEFYVNDSTGPTQWHISGTLGSYTVIEHGAQYFSYDTRTITILNGTPDIYILGQVQSDPLQTGWSSGNDGGYSWWLTNDNPSTDPPSEGIMAIALISPEPKYFQVASTANNHSEWATYFIRIIPECDYDNDGLPDRLDLDSDNDGCLDVVEGGGTFDYSDVVDASGMIGVGIGSPAGNQHLCSDPGCVDANGIPLVSGTSGQTKGSSQDSSAYDAACFISLAGTVFNDADGNTVIAGGETGTTAGTSLYVYLVDATGIVVDSASVQPGGTYTLNAIPNQTYTLLLTQEPYPVGTNTGTTPIDITLPDGWVHTGENGEGNAGSGDGTANGALEVVVGSMSVDNQNFGLQQLPDSDDKMVSISVPAAGDTLQIGAGILPGLSGTDPEDGVYGSGTGTVRQPAGIIITSLPTNGVLIYNGLPVAAGDTIFDEGGGVLQIIFTGAGYTSTDFEYAYIDAAGFADPIPATYHIDWSSPLPVTLLAFEVSKENNAARLSWTTTTASGQDNVGFHILHSTDGADWNEIGWVKSNTGHVIGNGRLDYTYWHPSPVSGSNRYQLKQLDQNGRYVYSPVRTVWYEELKRISIYPNPAKENVHIDGLKGNEYIAVYDMSGRSIYAAQADGKEVTIAIAQLADGVYQIRVTDGEGNAAVFRLVKTK